MSKLSINLVEWALVAIIIVAMARGCVGSIPEPASSPAASKQMYQEAHYRAIKSLRGEEGK